MCVLPYERDTEICPGERYGDMEEKVANEKVLLGGTSQMCCMLRSNYPNRGFSKKKAAQIEVYCIPRRRHSTRRLSWKKVLELKFAEDALYS